MASSTSSSPPVTSSSGQRGRTSSSSSSRSTPRPSGGRAASSPRTSPSGTGISPTRMSRVQEKEELQQLNDRLAKYIQRSIDLERQRAAMVLLLEEKEESQTREMSAVRQLYETELADARASLDDLANDRARLQLEVGNLSQELTQLRARTQKEQMDLAHAVTQWRNLEEAYNQKEADYNTQLAKTKRLTADVAELQAQQKHLDAVLADTRTQLNSEMLRRVDLENQMQTMKEQLDFERNIGKEEIHEIRRQHESRLVEVDSGRRAEFDSQLSEALQQLRQEHQAHMDLYRQELEHSFNAKLENAQQAALREGTAAKNTQEELTTTKTRLETLNTQLELHQREKACLEGRVQELERTLDRDREQWSRRLAQKDSDMQGMVARMNQQLDEYQSLMDVKLALDMEISAYRRMLEEEERRLRLSPSPVQRGTVAAARTHAARGAHRVRGKKRKMEESSGGTAAYTMSTNSTARGPVSIDQVDVEGNYVVLRNNSDQEQPLGGWVVRRTHPSITNVSFHIPPSCVLHGGQTLTIWAAGADVEADSGNLIMEGHRSWGPVTDVRVVLLTPDQGEAAERHVMCVQTTGEEGEGSMLHQEHMEGCDPQRLRRPPKRRKSICDGCSVS